MKLVMYSGLRLLIHPISGGPERNFITISFILEKDHQSLSMIDLIEPTPQEPLHYIEITNGAKDSLSSSEVGSIGRTFEDF